MAPLPSKARMQRRTWGRILRKFRQQRIGVVGDLMLDQYVWGTVARISPEAPVPVVRVDRESHAPGGGANVAANLAALGATTILFGVVGNDPPGELLLAELQQRGIHTDGILQDEGRRTLVKTRIIAHNQQVTRIDREKTEEIAAHQVEDLMERLSRNVADLNGLIISDYTKGTITPDLLRWISRLCRRDGISLFLDCKSRKFNSRLWFTAMTPNEHELEVLSGVPVRDEASIQRASRKLFALAHVALVLVTRGERGMMLFERGGNIHTIPSVAREVFDITGAGDTVIAAFTLAHASGASAGEAAIIGNAAASCVISKIGTATTSSEEIAQAIQQI